MDCENEGKKKKNWREGLGNIKWSETTSDMLGGKIEKKKISNTFSAVLNGGEKKKEEEEE